MANALSLMRFLRIYYLKSSRTEDMEKEINLFALSSAVSFRPSHAIRDGWKERRAKCTFTYSRVVPVPLIRRRSSKEPQTTVDGVTLDRTPNVFDKRRRSNRATMEK